MQLTFLVHWHSWYTVRFWFWHPSVLVHRQELLKSDRSAQRLVFASCYTKSEYVVWKFPTVRRSEQRKSISSVWLLAVLHMCILHNNSQNMMLAIANKIKYLVETSLIDFQLVATRGEIPKNKKDYSQFWYDMNYHFLYNSESDNSRCRPPVWGKRKPAVHDLRTAGLAEAVRFELTCPCGQPHFECGSLWPLRYASIYVNPGFPEVDAYSVLLEFPLELGGQTKRRTPKKWAVPRHPRPSASHVPASFRVRLAMTTSICFHIF